MRYNNTAFELPDYFVDRYDEELKAWGENFQKIGPVKSIVLKEGMWAAPSPDPEQGAILIGVKLIAKISTQTKSVTISPYTEEDERKIRQHCERMQRDGVPARLFTKEPPRPWLPFMPTIGNDEHGEQ